MQDAGQSPPFASFLFGKGLAEDGTPPIGLIGMSVLAGIVWPFLLAAVVEMTSFAVYSHAAASRATPIPDWWQRDHSNAPSVFLC